MAKEERTNMLRPSRETNGNLRVAKLLALAVLVLFVSLAAACGTTTDSSDVGSATQIKGGESTSDSPPTNRPDAAQSISPEPRALISLTSFGEAQTHVVFENYEQLRDYSDLAALVTIDSVRVSEPFKEPYLLPGTLDVTATISEVLGGRLSAREGTKVTFTLPMNANANQLERFAPKLETLAGLQYVIFAHKAVWSERPDTYEPILHGAPPVILSVWPDTGRITPIAPTNFLAEDAVTAGERATGTSAPPTPEWKPNYDGPAPIGMTVEELGEFAAAPGEPEVDPPTGWENLERYLALGE